MTVRPVRLSACAGAVGLALLLLTAGASGQSSGGSYTVRKHVVAGGGGESSGGSYRVQGTAGEAGAGPAPSGAMSAAGLALRGGFWTRGSGNDVIFRNGFEAPP